MESEKFTVGQVASAIEQYAPLNLQASYDNAGLVVGQPNREVTSVLIALDVTMDVISEAKELGANMIVTHHPIIFSPLKHLTSSTNVERCVERAIRNKIAIYSAHTNLDSAAAPYGMSYKVGTILGLCEMEVLESTGEGVGFGVVGKLPTVRRAKEFIDFVSDMLNVKILRHSEIKNKMVERVAICTGSGGSLINAARDSGADIYITGDLRHNDFLEATGRITVVDAGHYETEYCAIAILFDILSIFFPTFALHKSTKGVNPVIHRARKQAINVTKQL